MLTTKKSDENNNKSKDCLKLLLEWEIEGIRRLCPLYRYDGRVF